MNDPNAPARLANEIGRPHGLFCKYAVSRKTKEFTYQFFRHGHFLGETADAKKVISKMEKYAS